MYRGSEEAVQFAAADLSFAYLREVVPREPLGLVVRRQEYIWMARRRTTPELSADFLAVHRPRLDAIGAWTIDAYASSNGGQLDIDWLAPLALRNDWVPLTLQFRIGNEELPPTDDLYDPDETMFALYDLFVSRRNKFIVQLRAVVAETEQIAGPVERAKVKVCRSRHPIEHMCFCDLQVWLKFADDNGHSCYTTYHPAADRFGNLEG
ncbi:MAG: hypothetical protein ACRC8S_18875 [Fimbriiglobus sp.]